MFKDMTEQEAREQILKSVAAYCDTYHNRTKAFQPGDRIPYASRVYDSEEMVNLVDSALDFWLTAGRFTEAFEKSFAEYLGVPFDPCGFRTVRLELYDGDGNTLLELGDPF